jgi:hypothetical protein
MVRLFQFVETVGRADVEKAREMFERAMAASSGGVSPVGVYGAYAKFLWSTGGDRAKVIELFENACIRAYEADASSAADSAAAADVLASYASFLLVGGGAITARAEQMLRMSLSLQVYRLLYRLFVLIAAHRPKFTAAAQRHNSHKIRPLPDGHYG